jgi:radial spoke head protein 1
MIYPDGSRYKGKLLLNRGDFYGGKRNGTGVYLYGNGDVYQGEWEADVKHGVGTFGSNIGTYTYRTGGKKVGHWVNGNLKGNGEIIHVDHKIAGVFINNDDMEMPVDLIFPRSGFKTAVNDPAVVGMAVAAKTAE